jgi:hypothetical protein
MASIVLSFVGEQDPCSPKTNQEGSIVTLLRHLLNNNYEIAKIILMHTSGTKQGAKDTQEWIAIHEDLKLLSPKVELVPASEGLSEDPTDLLLAAQEARKGLELVRVSLRSGDRIEFNASSGTPAMKSSLSILQAAGYAPDSCVWQVRNPLQIKAGQVRVFQTDVGVFKQEFDIKVIKRQVDNYNYGGALSSLQESALATERLVALLKYGQRRMNFDFNGAFSVIQPFASMESQLVDDIAPLRQKQLHAIAKEIYFSALIKYQRQQYSEFLVEVSQFQECVLAHLIKSRLQIDLPDSYAATPAFWRNVQQFDDHKPYNHLVKAYEQKGWEIPARGFPSRPALIELLDYYSDYVKVIPSLRELNEYCEQRNRHLHKFEGVSEIEDEKRLLASLRSILKSIIRTPDESPFDILNQKIIILLGNP